LKETNRHEKDIFQNSFEDQQESSTQLLKKTARSGKSHKVSESSNWMEDLGDEEFTLKRFKVAGCELRVAGCELRVAGCELRVEEIKIQGSRLNSNFKLPSIPELTTLELTLPD
jgi:hypothetical protein